MSGRPSSSTAPRIRLVRPARPPLQAPDLDERQREVLAHRGGPLRLLGGPGTGVTTTVVEAVVDRIERDGLTPDQVLVLAPTRRAAADLRELITGRLARTVREPIARTPASLAFGILRRAAAAAGEPAPRLLSGPEQDVVLRELLAGHRAGVGRAPAWPDQIRDALATRGLRTELRDLLMRAIERGLGPDELAALGREHDRAEWVAAAQVLREYDEVTALATPGAYDPALILGAAERTLADDPELADEVRRSARFVAVDDAQELTPAAAVLLRELVGRGGELLLAGDPDAATLGFRGADPAFLAHGADDFARAGQATPTVVLRTCWRHGPELRAAVQRVVDRVGVEARSQMRRPVCADGLEPGSLSAHVLRGPVQEAAYIAGLLRRAHLLEGVPWSEMAVIVRGTGRAATLRRVLVSEGVPVQVPATELPVREESAVTPLLDAFEVSLGLAVAGEVGRAEESAIDVDTAVGLLTSPIGGADSVGLRRLRRTLRAEERAGGGSRSSDELLVEAVVRPGRVVTLEASVSLPVRRVAAVLEAGRVAAARELGPDGVPRFARSVTAETVLWAIWDATGLAEPWRRTALAGGAAGARADRDLDAVVALFDSAARFVDRLPQAGPAEFLEVLRGQEVPGDTLVERAPASEAVALLTPQGAAGRQWRWVVVAGVQAGVWPDTRLRGSLLGAQALTDVYAGRGDRTPEALRSAQVAVRQEELRLFHVAVSRPTQRLVVTAVSGEDEQPSGLLDLVAPDPVAAETDSSSTDSSSTDPSMAGPAGYTGDEERPVTGVPRALSLPALVAHLRQLVSSAEGEPAAAATAADALAELAAAGVPGADPSDWYALAPLSDDAPIVPPGEPVVVSPSRVESFEQCGLRWMLESSGGTVPAQLAQSVGNLVHELASDHPAAGVELLRAELARRWPRLGLGRGWVADQQRERAERMVVRLGEYYARMRAEGRELLAVERSVSVRIGRAVVTGRVDRLELTADGAGYIVDLKTGRTAVSDDDVAVNRQLGIYQVALDAGGFEPEITSPTSGGGELVMLGVERKTLPVKVQPPLPPDDPEVGRSWAAQLLEDVTEGMAGAGFVAQQGPHCRTCPVRTSCPTQSEGRSVTS